MVRTRQEDTKDLKYVINDLMGLNQDKEVEKAILDAGYTDLSLFLAISDDELDAIEVKVDDTNKRPLNRIERGKITSFQSYVIHRQNIGKPIDPNGFHSIKADDFRAYKLSADYVAVRTGLTGPPNLVPLSRDPVSEFKRGIKRDINQYIVLKDGKQWDAWQRSTLAMARSQAVDEVFDSTCSPVSPRDIDLFKEKQKFVYAVFDKCLQTDQGKAFVREHAKDSNAQTVYKKLCDHYEQSTVAAVDSGRHLKYITTAKLGDGTWSGTNSAFLLHWTDQVRKYNNLVSTSD